MKNLLIEDYIKLMCINKKYFVNKPNDDKVAYNYFNTKILCEKTLSIYETLIQKYNKNDISLLLVKNEIYSAPNMDIEVTAPTLSDVYDEIIKLLSTLNKFSKSSKIKETILSNIFKF